jgi:hypothetical protein
MSWLHFKFFELGCGLTVNSSKLFLIILLALHIYPDFIIVWRHTNTLITMTRKFTIIELWVHYLDVFQFSLKV